MCTDEYADVTIENLRALRTLTRIMSPSEYVANVYSGVPIVARTDHDFERTHWISSDIHMILERYLHKTKLFVIETNCD